MRVKRILVAAGAAAAVAGTAASFTAVATGGQSPLRLGVVVDCSGYFRGFQQQMLAGAELPFLEHGAHLRSADPSDGVTDATLPGGRRVRLLQGCDEGGEFTTLIAAVRRLVELDHADVVVGGTWPGDGIVLAQIARRYPHAQFVAASAGPQEVTLARPSPNLFRVRPSFGQEAAGLGFYTRTALGWRRAAVLLEDDEEGWGEAAAFAAEFCAAGGRVVEWQKGFPLAVTPAAARRLGRQVDGVAIFSAGVTDPGELLPGLVRGLGARRVVVGLGVAADPRAGSWLAGIVTPARVPPPAPSLRLFAARMRAAFPGLPAATASSGFTVDFDTSVEAVLQAAARGGDLRSALGRLVMRLPTGELRVDSDGQAVVPATLVRHGAGREKTVARFAGVPQLLDGLLAGSNPPSRAARPCRRAPLPAYARAFVSRQRPSR